MKAPVPTDEIERLVALHALNLIGAEEDYLDRLVRVAAAALGVPTAFISLVDAAEQWFAARVGLDLTCSSRDAALCAHTIMQDEILVVPNALLDPRFAESPLVAGPPHIRFYAGAPLTTPAGFNIGTLCIVSGEPRAALDPSQRALLQEFARAAMDLISLRRAQGHMDPLTRLPNRAQLQEDLAALIAVSRNAGEPTSVMIIDAADAREYNEIVGVLGNASADALVATAATRLRDILPARLPLYHLGAFRFGVVLPAALLDETTASSMGIVEALSQPMADTGIAVTLSPCTGLAHYPLHGQDALSVSRAAVSAVYDARSRRKPHALFDPRQHEAQHRDFVRLADLRRALDGGDELRLHFQPKLDMASGRCRTVEGLIRWARPGYGFVPPGDFIRLAEVTGLIGRVTDWVLRRGIETLARWQRSGIELGLALNISANDLASPAFQSVVRELLFETGVDASALELEITETALIADNDETRRHLELLRTLGVRIAIDDYGTGQSSLAYLRDLPITTLKVDQRFIRALEDSPKDRVIVRSTMELAHELGLEVVAEGVETENALNLLLGWSCDVAQGYLIAKPMAEDDLHEWLMTQELTGAARGVRGGPACCGFHGGGVLSRA